MAELSAVTNASVYNQVYHVQKPDYPKEVTDESEKAFIFVLLTSSQGTNVESRVLVEIWRELASKFGDVKFCQIRADLCIEGYPERNTPTVLVYRNGDIRKQIVTLRELNGPKTKAKDFERVLIELDAVKANDSRLTKDEEESEDKPRTGALRGAKVTAQDDEDSDWD
jgi:hypothetical protein